MNRNVKFKQTNTPFDPRIVYRTSNLLGKGNKLGRLVYVLQMAMLLSALPQKSTNLPFVTSYNMLGGGGGNKWCYSFSLDRSPGPGHRTGKVIEDNS